MAFHFSSPFKVPIPRRFLLLGLCAAIVVLLLNLFAPSSLPPLLSDSLTDEDGYFATSKWLPSMWDTEEVVDRPPEFDETGQCLFLSPYDALSPEEKRRAEYMVLEEVSAGVVRAKEMPDDPMDDRPRGPSHPILALLKQGEQKWNAKMNNQSKTIEEAVERYRAKWNRNPPKYFDRWWKFASSVHVLLPDEYDA
jgi:beta-1,2-xylosyltransferase